MNETEVLERWVESQRIFETQALFEGAYLTEVDVVNGWSLPLRNNKPALPPIRGLGWQQEHIDALMKHPWQDVQVNSTLDDEKAVLLSFAGGYTYGHWIIDIPARLEMVRRTLIDEKLLYLVPGPPPPWIFPFLAAYNVTPELCVPIHEHEKVHVKRLFAPSFMRVNDYLPEWPFAASFARLRAYGQTLAAKTPKPQGGRRLWVRRTVTGPSRASLDEAALAGLMDELSFEVVTPSTMSIGEQAALFDAADIIVGEDSSSLHNIVWGHPKVLVVLNATGQINLLHFSMCKLMGIACHYLSGDVGDGGTFAIDHELVRSTVAEAERTAASPPASGS